MKRYDFDTDDCGHIFGMEEQENGDWVKALDHDLIVSKLDLQLIALAESNDKFRTLVTSEKAFYEAKIKELEGQLNAVLTSYFRG